MPDQPPTRNRVRPTQWFVLVAGVFAFCESLHIATSDKSTFSVVVAVICAVGVALTLAGILHQLRSRHH